MASAPRTPPIPSETMSIEELKQFVHAMEACYPFEATIHPGRLPTFNAFAYAAMQAILPTSFALLATLDDVLDLKFKDLKYVPGRSPRFMPHFKITLKGRSECLFFLNGSFGLRNLHQITEEEVQHELNVQLFLFKRWYPYARSLNDRMTPENYVFPFISHETGLDWTRPMPRDLLQQMLDDLSLFCGIPKTFGMSSPRHGDERKMVENGFGLNARDEAATAGRPPNSGLDGHGRQQRLTVKGPSKWARDDHSPSPPSVVDDIRNVAVGEIRPAWHETFHGAYERPRLRVVEVERVRLGINDVSKSRKTRYPTMDVHASDCALHAGDAADLAM
ncbi:hypothetical protein H0H93_008549, partial [Arthromyces matolae]